ncbi:hypothetical protein H8959_003314, partial [Pygathrix nigripes]
MGRRGCVGGAVVNPPGGLGQIMGGQECQCQDPPGLLLQPTACGNRQNRLLGAVAAASQGPSEHKEQHNLAAGIAPGRKLLQGDSVEAWVGAVQRPHHQTVHGRLLGTVANTDIPRPSHTSKSGFGGIGPSFTYPHVQEAKPFVPSEDTPSEALFSDMGQQLRTDANHLYREHKAQQMLPRLRGLASHWCWPTLASTQA